MANWRKVFAKSEKFTDKFKPFKTENKRELLNRAEFSGDKFPSSGDSAKKELEAWKAGNKLSKKDRKTEQASCNSAVLNEKVKREDWGSQKTSNWRNTLIKKTAEVSFQQKPDGAVNIDVTTPDNNSTISPVQESTTPPLEGNEDLDEEADAPKSVSARFFTEDELRKYNGRERLKGGKGDNRPIEDFKKDQVEKGMKVEMEHTSDPEIAQEIVKDHLTEFPDNYYTLLNKMEDKAKKGNLKKKSNYADIYLKFINTLGDIIYRCDERGIVEGLWNKTPKQEIDDAIRLGLLVGETDIINKFKQLVADVKQARMHEWDEDSGWENYLKTNVFGDLFNFIEEKTQQDPNTFGQGELFSSKKADWRNLFKKANEQFDYDFPNLDSNKIYTEILNYFKNKGIKIVQEEKPDYYDTGIDLNDDKGNSYFIGIFDDHFTITDNNGKLIEIPYSSNVKLARKLKISRKNARSLYGKFDNTVKDFHNASIKAKGSAADEDPSSIGGAAWVDIAAGNLTDEQSIINSILNKAEEEGVEFSLNDAKQRYLRWKSWKKRQASLNIEAKSPPGRKHEVEKLKEEGVPEDEAFAIAWKQHKEHGKPKKKKASWRQTLAAAEPDIHFKRKPDGTFQLDVTQPVNTPAEPELPVLNTTPPAPQQEQQSQEGITPTSSKKLNWKTYRVGDEVLIDRIPGFSAGGDGPNSQEIMEIKTKYDSDTGEAFDVVVTDTGSQFDTRTGECIKGPRAYYMVVDSDESQDEPLPSARFNASQKDECTETPKKEWIIKEAKANDKKTYQLIGRECDKFCGIFIEKKIEGILPKVASKLTKGNVIDFEKVDRIGDTWRENINEAAWISKFDAYISNIK